MSKKRPRSEPEPEPEFDPNEPINRCAMCRTYEFTAPTDIGKRPAQCLIFPKKDGGERRAHRICEDCWFNPVWGFAMEGRDHRCPGCVNKLPPNDLPKKYERVEVDLTSDTEDDDTQPTKKPNVDDEVVDLLSDTDDVNGGGLKRRKRAVRGFRFRVLAGNEFWML